MGAKRSPESIKGEKFLNAELAAGRTPSVSQIAAKSGLTESTIRRSAWYKAYVEKKAAASASNSGEQS